MEKYIFRRYDPSYRRYFLSERKRLQKALGKNAQIEHVGSTSIPGLGGKGILDIIIGTQKNLVNSSLKRLQKNGYEFRESASTKQRLFFRRDYRSRDGSERRVHLHLTFIGSKDWIEILKFRDYLLTHPIEIKEYEKIKRKAIEQANGEGSAYRKIKERFILEVINTE